MLGGLQELSRQRIFVYGAGGHAKVVIDILDLNRHYEIVGIVDDNLALVGKQFCDYPILGDVNTLLMQRPEAQLILAIGDNKTRERLSRQLESFGFQFATAIHPSSTIARNSTIGVGTVVTAHAVVNPGAVIGEHVVINTGATVDHDCMIGDFAHISPGAHLASAVNIETLVHVGTGASIIPNVTVGARSIIGAGAAVTTDIPPDVVAVGVPARISRTVR